MQGKRIVIAGRTVEFPNAPTVLHRLFWDNHMQPPASDEIRAAFWESRLPEIEAVNEILQAEATRRNAIYLDKRDYACEAERHQCFALNDDGYPLHYDYGHYTVEGAKFFGQRIVDQGWLNKLD